MIIRGMHENDAPVRVSGAGAFPVVSGEDGKSGALRSALSVIVVLCILCGAAIAGTVFGSAVRLNPAGLFAAETVYAADDSYTTESFDVSIDVSENHVMRFDEHIVVDFLTPHHGIYRYIPIQKKFYDISGISVSGGDWEDEYDTTGENEYGTYGNEILKIGDAYRTYTGEKEYRIQYNLNCTKDDDEDYDWMSVDILPTGWQTPIEKSTINLTMPKEVDWSTFSLYTGSAGESIDVLSDTEHFTVTFGDDNKTMEIEAKDLPQGYGITLQAILPEGYWTGVTSRRWMGFLAFLIPIALGILMSLLWVINGRDPEIVKPVEFYPPDDITPAEVGYIVDGCVDNKDLSSMIIYFASKGYLEIREKRPGSKKYELVKKCEIPDSEPTFAVRLFGGLFPYEDAIKASVGRSKGGSKSGTANLGLFVKAVIKKSEKAEPEPDEKEPEFVEQVVDLDNLPDGFGDAVRVARDELQGMYDSGKKRMFTTGSREARKIGAFICSLILPAAILIANFVNYKALGMIGAAVPFILVLIGTSLISSSYDRRHSSARVKSVGKFMGGLVVCAIASLITFALCMAAYSGSRITGILVALVATGALADAIFFQVYMWARTKENALIYGKVLGFRNFIETAEHDRLVALSNDNPEYYYNIMPYAMVMGMSTAWAKKFENIKVPEPEWYAGTNTANLGRAVWYNNIANNCAGQFVRTSSMIPDISDAADSGGFFTGGGGSFSGGGFGGGGFSGGGFGGGGGGAW